VGTHHRGMHRTSHWVGLYALPVCLTSPLRARLSRSPAGVSDYTF
jgi:hypothetical protein